MKKIGLSVSRCISDIIAGKVSEDDVAKIIARTAARDEEDWLDLIARYQKKYWSKNPKEAASICNRLIKAGKIVQPRLAGQEPPDVRSGHWIEAKPAMNIYALSGHKVVVTQASIYDGSESDQEKARKLLKIGEIYQVERTKVYSCHTDVFIKGVSGHFNSVTFEDVVEQSAEADKKHPDWKTFNQ